MGPPFLRGRAGSSDVARNAFGDDDCDGMECPVDCVEEVLDFDTLKQLTEDSGSWQVTVSSSGEIKEQGQKVRNCTATAIFFAHLSYLPAATHQQHALLCH